MRTINLATRGRVSKRPAREWAEKSRLVSEAVVTVSAAPKAVPGNLPDLLNRHGVSSAGRTARAVSGGAQPTVTATSAGRTITLSDGTRIVFTVAQLPQTSRGII